MRFLFIALFALLFPGSAMAAWVKGESTHFIGYSDGKEAELRADLIQLEQIASGRSTTPFLRFGDSVRIEMFGRDGGSLFGAIEQRVVKA